MTWKTVIMYMTVYVLDRYWGFQYQLSFSCHKPMYYLLDFRYQSYFLFQLSYLLIMLEILNLMTCPYQKKCIESYLIFSKVVTTKNFTMYSTIICLSIWHKIWLEIVRIIEYNVFVWMWQIKLFIICSAVIWIFNRH